MPRKKSATKVAREQKEKELAKKIAEAPENKPLPLDIEDLKKELREEEASEEESDEEDEDDYGQLLTEDVEHGLNEVLKAIKTGDQRLFDSNVAFFKETDPSENDDKKEELKPIFLKEYHRKTLLEGEDEESGNFASVDGEKTYVDQQKEDKENLIKEMHNAIGEDDSDDEGFLVKKQTDFTEQSKLTIPVALPDPEKEGGEKFLEAFLENQAWLPNKGEKVDVEYEDDGEFDAAAEQFENAYNFRFEDPKATEIISYARSQATMRREKMNSRKRERLKAHERKTEEKEEIKEELKKKKQKKVNLVVDRIKEIREAVGEEISEDRILKIFGDALMNEDFSNEDWDAKMSQIFDDEYYQNDDEELVKPEWDDEVTMAHNSSSGEENGDDEKVEEKEEVEADTVESDMSRKSKKKEEKHSKRQEKNKIKEVAEKLVESKTLDILDEVEEERGRGKEKKYVFKYREVSPESFGLTYNEILSADDKALNDLIGLKKLAPYRPQEKSAKDKRKITKSKNMREWRKKTFGSEAGISEKADLDIKIPSIVFDNALSHDEGPKRKMKKANKKKERK